MNDPGLKHDLKAVTMAPDFRNLRVLVIGDLMLDHYVHGDATRISPEAPVPVVHVERDKWVLGGAGNVAANLAGLGVRTTLLGAYGEDEAGGRLEGLAATSGIALLPAGRSPERPTIRKTRVIVQRQQMCRVDREAAPDCYALDSVPEKEWHSVLLGSDAVIVSDYAKGTVTEALLEKLRGFRGKDGFLLALDPKPKRHLDLSGLDLLTPNRTEALQLAGFPADPHGPFDDEAVGRAIREKFGPARLVVTLGAKGMLLYESGCVVGRMPTRAREVFDVSGAGDTVVATLVASLSTGLSLPDAAELANRAAGIVVSRVGTSPIRIGEIAKDKPVTVAKK